MAKKLAARTQEIRPVGAWVQPAINNNQDAVVSSSELSTWEIDDVRVL